MTVQVSASDVYAAWRAYTTSLRTWGPDAASTRRDRERYQRLAAMHESLTDAWHDLEHENR